MPKLMPKLPKRVSTALINALAAGVVPRVGLEHISVGREQEIDAIARDLDNIGEGGASFRFIIGRYGTGKSFILQLIRNLAMERGFVVADADLSPELRLAGGKQQALSTYRELMKNIATRTSPKGGAIALILEKWTSGILSQVAQETGKRPGDEGFDERVEIKIRQVIDDLEGLVHGFDFANVIISYWQGYREENRDKQEAALRWLRGEFATKTEAKASSLDVRVTIDDETWYDYVKLWAKFVADIGYKGLIIFLDEAIHLYKISHSRSRQSNYDRLLAMFNDTMQGKADRLGIIVCGTPQFLEDKRRGLYSDEAWRTRLAKSRFLQDGLQDSFATAIALEPLTTQEISQLLHRLADIHAHHYGYQKQINSQQIEAFQQESSRRIGAEKMATPRESVRDFISLLNVLQQNPKLVFTEVMRNAEFQFIVPSEGNNGTGEFAEITLN